MAESIAVTRARIACRIYLALYDAGHDGVVIQVGVDFVPGVPIPEDPALVREVVERLRSVGVIQERDSSSRSVAVLHPDLTFRMGLALSYPLTIVERFRRDLAAIDSGQTNVMQDFLNLESMVRTAHTHTRGL